MVHERIALAIGNDENESEKVEICLASTNDYVVENTQLASAELASDKALLHSLYSQIMASSSAFNL